MSRKRNATRRVVEYDVEDIGVEHAQYFEGRGTALTSWDEVAIGVGQDYNEALEDAVEQLATNGWDGADRIAEAERGPAKAVRKHSVEAYLEKVAEEEEVEPEDLDSSEFNYYVAVYVSDEEGEDGDEDDEDEDEEES